MTRSRRRFARVCGLLLLVTAPRAATAQVASPWLPADHWTAPVIARFHALGGLEADPVPSSRPTAGLVRELSGAYRQRLAEEHVGGARVRVEAGAVLDRRRGLLRPGGYDVDRVWLDPAAVPDAAGPELELRADVQPASWLAASAGARAGSAETVVQHAVVSVAAAGLLATVGRRHLGYVPGAGGGLVLAALHHFDGASMGVARPFRLPLLGPTRVEAAAGRLERNGFVDAPWLASVRVHTRPHARLDVGATRVAIFGGMSGARVGLREIALVAVGANLSGDFADDQVASLDVRWRPRTGIELFGEVGMHDVDAGVLFDVPGFTLGVRVPHLGFGDVGVAAEHTQISGSCCGNPPWYRHYELSDGWVADGALLGHPLGGQGREWRMSVTGGVADAALLFHVAAAARSRGVENLLAPARQGRSSLVDAAVDARIASDLAGRIRLAHERGDGWRESRARVGIHWFAHRPLNRPVRADRP